MLAYLNKMLLAINNKVCSAKILILIILNIMSCQK
jgi:hypothetical protein